MNPVSDTDFAAQMAQFTALQTDQTMQGNMASLQANTLLGQTVQVQPGSGSPVTGVVSSVTYEAGVPSLIVNGGSYSLSQIMSVLPPSAATPGSTSNTSPTQSN